MLPLTGAEVGECFIAGRKSDRRPPAGRPLIEDRHGQGIADADQVAQVDEAVDRRDRALLGQAPEECLGG